MTGRAAILGTATAFCFCSGAAMAAPFGYEGRALEAPPADEPAYVSAAAGSATGVRPLELLGGVEDDLSVERELNVDVADAIESLGLVQDRGAEASDRFGRVSLRFVDDDEPLRRHDLRDAEFDAGRSELAPVETRTRLSAGAVHDAAIARAPDVGAAYSRGADLRFVPGGFAHTRSFAGLDMSIEPHARVGVRADRTTAGAGAIVRLGRNINEPREGDGRGWYMFVGADAQAVTWRLSPGLGVADAVRLEDRAIVGDAQAGFAYQLTNSSHFAVGVIHRETRYQDARTDEQFAGVSFSIRR